MSRRFRLHHGAVAAALIAAAGLVHSASAQTAPPAPPACAADPNYRQLDYLVGHWDAFKTDGSKTAEVILEPALDGCTVTFAWKPVVATAQTGTGFFTYSRLRKSPMFLYAGNKGGDTAALKAEAKPNDITFLIEYPSASGTGTTVRRFRLALQADGSMLETSHISDNGAPFKPSFEAHWKKHQ
ncbi:hypothetical protein SAMN05428989_2051 [Pseudoxanthomonas sp. GM95]|uniref:hypothetical protein n=1 Tax=Pseudoxanthomonas sp. GM95 TaxID=1881043 RepID=UPI0008BA0012|nr:hypothetical protein [Pseudoxanthomonas sp. GM95]SEL60820.1 hypothetical protein SAMN05428989_2051 [Pseudoxanthomonas sp. GM95]